MALIACPKCGRDVSDTASACPECAYIFRSRTPVVPYGGQAEPSSFSWWPTVSIGGRVAVGMILVILARVEQELGAVTGMLGLLIAGSAIPAWARFKRERLRVGGSDAGRLDDLEDRLAELENRHLAQITDLETRVDFAERMLTKQREQIGSGE